MNTARNSLGALLFLLLPGFATAHVAIATDGQVPNHSILFYKHGEYLERYSCRPNEPLKIPQNCKEAPVAKQRFNDVKSRALKVTSALLQSLDEHTEQVLAECAAIDSKIDSVLNATGSPSEKSHELEALERRLLDLQERLQAVSVRKRELAIQISNKEIHVADSPNADLAQQLAVLRLNLKAAKSQWDDLFSSLQAVRQEIATEIARHSTESAVNLMKALMSQRFSKVQEYDSLQRKTENATMRLASTTEFFDVVVADESFTHEFSPEQIAASDFPYPSARELAGLFHSQQELNGTWLEGCREHQNISSATHVKFDRGWYEGSTLFYLEPGCQNLSFALSFRSRFELLDGNAEDSSLRVFFTNQTMWYTTWDPSVVKAFNAMGNCGSTDWQVGIAKQIVAGCREVPQTEEPLSDSFELRISLTESTLKMFIENNQSTFTGNKQ